MRTYIHNSWVWTGGERREEGLKQCLHGVICDHQGILLSYYWILLHDVLTVKKTLESGKRRQHTKKKPTVTILYVMPTEVWLVTDCVLGQCGVMMNRMTGWTGLDRAVWTHEEQTAASRGGDGKCHSVLCAPHTNDMKQIIVWPFCHHIYVF